LKVLKSQFLTHHRPVPIWLRALVTLLAAVNVATIIGALINLQIAAAVPSVSVSPLAQLAFGGVWLVIFVWLLYGMQRRMLRVCAAVAPVLTSYALIGLAWNLVLTRSTYSRETFGFDALISVLILLAVWWTEQRHGWLRGWLRTSQTGDHTGSPLQ
jgi:hypothetical protein